MTTTRCSAALDDATLEAWWLGELDAGAALRADEHLLGCAACAQRAQALVAIAHGVHDATRAGAVRAVAGDALLERLAASGLRLREYRVPWNGSVNCTVAPDDDVMVARLQAPLAGVTRLDAVVTRSVDGAMSVLEAWACGLPVLMTEECHLPEGFAAGAAVRIGGGEGMGHLKFEISGGMGLVMAMSDEERAVMGRRGRELVEERFVWPKVARQMRTVYEWVLGTGPKPECVRM